MRDPEAIRQVVADLEQELAEKQAEMDTLKAGIDALRLMLKGRTGGVPDASTSSSHAPTSMRVTAPSPGVEAAPDGPRGREAILTVLEEHPGRWVTIGDLTDILVERGWVESAKPREAVRTSADRLAKDDDSSVQKARGKYRLAQQSEPQEEVERRTRVVRRGPPLDIANDERRSDDAAPTNVSRLLPD